MIGMTRKSLERPQRVRQFVLKHVFRTVPLSVLESGLPVSRYAEAAKLYDSGDDLLGGGVHEGAVPGEDHTLPNLETSPGGEDNAPSYLKHHSLHRSLDAAYDNIYRGGGYWTDKFGELLNSLFK